MLRNLEILSAIFCHYQSILGEYVPEWRKNGAFSSLIFIGFFGGYAPDYSVRGIKYYARLANLSLTEFKRSFKDLTGFGAFDYWKLTNLQKGLWRLLTTEDSVKEIALDVGYNGAAAFDKSFRNVFEESPSSTRKRFGAIFTPDSAAKF